MAVTIYYNIFEASVKTKTEKKNMTTERKKKDKMIK